MASVAAAGCLDDDSEADDTPTSTGDLDFGFGSIETTNVTGNLMITAATPVRSFNYQGDFTIPFTVAENTTGFVFELVWEPTQTATSGDLALWVQPTNAGTVPPADPMDLVDRPAPILQVSGGSPLRATLAAADFPETGDWEIVLRAAEPVNVTYDQDYALSITEFTDVAFDAEYTTL
ncbi:MAG: hypothetical protein ACPGQL_09540 [Thermoplasmatota archaeon]